MARTKAATKRPDKTQDNTEVSNFSTSRAAKIRQLYSDEVSTDRRYRGWVRRGDKEGRPYNSAIAVREALQKGITNKDSIVKASQELYATNPIYASIINYFSNMFLWRYKVIPHRLYTKSKAKIKKEVKEDDFKIMYNLMLEIADGMGFETKMPALLSLLFTNGGVYFTTICDENSQSLDTILLPDKYCKKIGETQFGTAIISFNFSYFDTLGLTEDQLKEYFKSFPAEFAKLYKKYRKDMRLYKWMQLDPRFSSGVLLNDLSLPTYFYLLSGIINYEKYQDNELERNENLLKYLVVQEIPHYEDQLIFEVDEVDAMHKSMREIIDKGEKSRLITTYGNIHVEQIGESDTAANEVLQKAFKSIYNNIGLNDAIFTGESVTALTMSLLRDKNMVWKYVKAFLNFYNIAINNWFDFKLYQADIDLLPISSYTYSDDIEIYRSNATLGVGKLDLFIASGVRQKHIQDQLDLESFLKLDQIMPMQTSYTQTAEDRNGGGDDGSEDKDTKEEKEDEDGNSGIEPTEKKS